MAQKLKIRLAVRIYRDSLHEKIRLPDGSSIFTAESKAIDMALDYIMNNSLENKFVIFSDSHSVLKSLNHTSSKNPKIQNVIEKHHELSKTKEILFCWLPSHVGIKGNEAADVKAEASLDLEISNFKLLHVKILNLLSTGTSCPNGSCPGTERHLINYMK